MLCRHRVGDFGGWTAVFDSPAGSHRRAGLDVLYPWRSPDAQDNVPFLSGVDSRERALAFISDPAGAGRRAGVLDGEIHLQAQLPGY